MTQRPPVFTELEWIAIQARDKLIEESRPTPTLDEQQRLGEYFGVTDAAVAALDPASFGYWLRFQLAGAGEPRLASLEYPPVATDRPRTPVPALPVEVAAHMLSESRNLDRTEHLIAAAVEAYEREVNPKQVNTPQVLYRFFNKAGTLLYIGITGDPAVRWKHHGKVKPWWPEVVTITVQNYPTRRAVENAEKSAIKAERPIHNVTYNRRPVLAADGTVPLRLGGAEIGESTGTYQQCLLHFQGCPHWNDPA